MQTIILKVTMKRKTKIVIGILILLILIQFIKPGGNYGNAFGRNDFTHEIKVPDSVIRILKVSCFDCHSNHTNYPWYAQTNPIYWWLNNHVNNGKRELNFTEFGTYTLKQKNKKLAEIAEEVKKHEMPLSSYTLIHSNAKLNEQQIEALVQWSKSARGQIRLSPK